MTTVEAENISEDKEGMTNWMTVAMVVLIGVLLFLYYRNETFINYKFKMEYPIWIVFWVIISSVLISAKAWYWFAKLQSPQFLADNIHSSITGRGPIPYGGYMFVKLGCIDWGVVTERFTDGTAIYPASAHNQIGSNITANVRMHKTDVSDMPTVCRNGIIRYTFKPPYYYGEISEQQFKKVIKLVKPDMTEDQKQQIYSLIGKLNEADAGYMAERLREESKMCSYHERDKNVLQRDISTKVDLIARIAEKPSKWQKIREKVLTKKEEATNV